VYHLVFIALSYMLFSFSFLCLILFSGFKYKADSPSVVEVVCVGVQHASSYYN